MIKSFSGQVVFCFAFPEPYLLMLSKTDYPSIFAKIKIPSILVARQRTSHVLNLLSIAILQNIANTLFASTGVRKGMLLYCFRFELILNSWLLSQKMSSARTHRAERRSYVA